MTFDVPFFTAAVLLLLLPVPYTGFGVKTDGRGRSQSVTVFGMFRAWQNWLDAIRGGVGAWLLFERSIVVDASSASLALYLKLGIVAVGALIQTLRFGPGVSVYFPLFFLSGVTAVVPGYQAGGFAVLFAWVFTGGSRNPLFHLPVLGLSLGVGGYFLTGMTLLLKFSVGLIFAPLLMAVLLRRRPLFVSRERPLLTRRSPYLKPPAAAPAASKPPESKSAKPSDPVAKKG
jgi:hypothetical protein